MEQRHTIHTEPEMGVYNLNHQSADGETYLSRELEKMRIAQTRRRFEFGTMLFILVASAVIIGILAGSYAAKVL